MSNYGNFKPLTLDSGTAGDVVGPGTNTDGFIPQWNGANSHQLKNGVAAPAGTIVGTSDTQTLSAKTLTSAGDITHATGKQWKGKGGTAAATAGAAEIDQQVGVVTTEALTTAGLASYTLTLTNSLVAATSIVFASVQQGTSSAGVPLVGLITPGTGSVTIEIRNTHAVNAFNGTLKISFMVINPG